MDYCDGDNGDCGACNDFDGVDGYSLHYGGTSYGANIERRLPGGVLWPGADSDVTDSQHPSL